MKLIKFITFAALVASTSLVSGGHHTSPVGLTQDVARVCPDWPYCREVDIAEQTTDLQQQMKTAVVVTQGFASVCPDWPYCREVDIADQTTDQQQQMKTAIVLKAA